ncbi:riboflavin kinase [Psychrobacillus sp. NPDC096426]|uniref:riboflavin kinase n=1 Tax=Psychrobacillus sp. NPDC096426 TaxID=3364491 RepID=UPI003827A8E9
MEYLSDIQATLKGTVVKGNQLGRTLGFPTANLSLESKTNIPTLNGVYSVFVYYNRQRFMGVMNVGVKPTFENEQREKTFEVYIFDFHKSIYDETLEVVVCRFIRNEQKFDSIESMIQQLNKDCIAAKGYLDGVENKKKWLEHNPASTRSKKHEQVIHMPDLDFARFCDETYGVNRGIYNTVDKWFANHQVINIVKRRESILHFLDWVTFYFPEDKKVKFGSKGLSEQLEHFLYNVRDKALA